MRHEHSGRSRLGFRPPLGALLLAASAAGQAPILAPADEQVPSGASCARLVDVDGDGDVDLVGVAPAFGPGVLLNDGTGTFAAPGGAYAPGTASPTSAAVADFDGDNVLDVAWVNGGTIELRLGVAPGVFAPTAAPFPSPPLLGNFGTFTVDAGDVDQDGDQDLLIGQPTAGFANTFQAQTRLFLNDGAATFVDATVAAGLSPGNVVARFVDLDGDGLLDAVGHYTTLTSSYTELPLVAQRNLGGGVFGPVVGIGATPLGASTQCGAVPVSADLDGDGLVDFLLVGPTTNAVRWIRQSAPFVFTYQPSTSIGSRCLQGLLAFDATGDGVADPVLVFDDTLEARPLTAGAIGAATAAAPHGGAALAGDVDQDGDVDVLIADARGQRRWVFQDGVGGFVAPYGRTTAGVSRLSEIGQGWVAQQALADIDGDGRTDFAALVGVAPLQPSSLRYALVDAEGRVGPTAFATVSGMPAGVDFGFGAMFDLDGDGDSDALFTHHFYGTGTTAQYYAAINQGGGVFVASAPLLPAGSFPTNNFNGRVAWGDVDQDGDFDAVVMSRASNFLSSQIWVLVNDGLGGLTAAPPLLVASNAARLGVGDLDGDGDLDLAYVEGATGGRTLMNQGALSFVPGATFVAGAGGAVVVADFDGDGDGDVMSGATLSLRQGGVFVDGDLTGGAYPAQQTTPADIDSDGDLDVLLHASKRWYLNVGGGAFVDGGAAPGLIGVTQRPPLFGDFDGDGDLDAFTYDIAAMVNRTRGLHLGSYPRAGGFARLEFSGPASGTWLLAVSSPPSGGALATPFGALALDLSTLVILGTGSLDAAGAAAFGGPLPAASAAPLIGTPLVYQALVDGASGPRLTNARTLPILAY